MKFIKIIFSVVAVVASLLVLVVLGAGAVLLSLPDVRQIEGCFKTSMFSVDLCPQSPHYVKIKSIAPEVGEAVVASEDTSFYSHNGFDWYEIEQSFRENLEHHHVHRGGSTLTQQLAKNLWLTKERSYWRKLKEAYLTYELEKKFEKSYILEKYLNVVQFGPKLFGVKDAANFYFHKAPAELHLLDAVWLAFLLPNPDVYSQSFKKGKLTPFAEKILKVILNRMVSFKKIRPEEYHFAVLHLHDFPWNQLTRADFANAHSEEPPPAPDESPLDDPDSPVEE